MTQLTDSVYAVEVPDKVANLNLYRINGHAIMLEWDDVERPFNPYTCRRVDEYYGNLIDYKWPKILCTTRTCTPNQAREITGEQLYPSIALAGMCKAKGLDERKNYALLKKG